tara:strand:- start:906 stop:1283 length:378 start_codon:yes stop_codon:yes gene_type:complete
MKVYLYSFLLFLSVISSEINSSPLKSNLILNSELDKDSRQDLFKKDKELLLYEINQRKSLLINKEGCLETIDSYIELNKCIFNFRKSNRKIRNEIGTKRNNLYSEFELIYIKDKKLNIKKIKSLN